MFRGNRGTEVKVCGHARGIMVGDSIKVQVAGHHGIGEAAAGIVWVGRDGYRASEGSEGNWGLHASVQCEGGGHRGNHGGLVNVVEDEMETFLIDVVILISFFSGARTWKGVESQGVDLHGWQVELVCQVARDKDRD